MVSQWAEPPLLITLHLTNKITTKIYRITYKCKLCHWLITLQLLENPEKKLIFTSKIMFQKLEPPESLRPVRSPMQPYPDRPCKTNSINYHIIWACTAGFRPTRNRLINYRNTLIIPARDSTLNANFHQSVQKYGWNFTIYLFKCFGFRLWVLVLVYNFVRLD